MRFISKTKLITISIISLLSIFIATPAYADLISDKMIEQQIVMDNITLKQEELDKLSNSYTEALIKQQELEEKINQIKKEINQTNKKIQNNKQQLEKQCVSLYKKDDIKIIDIILKAEDFESFVTNFDFYNKYLNQTEELLNQNKELKNQLEEQKQQEELNQEELKKTIQEIEESKKAADAMIAELQQQYDNLDNEIANLIVEQLTSQYIQQSEISTSLSDGTVAAYMYQNEELFNKVSETISNYSGNNDIISRAYNMLGTPYSWGGTTSAGFDCSGFVSYCLTGEEGVRLGTTETFSNWTEVTDPQPGDVCVIHNGNNQHTGIYVGDGNMIHAATYGVGVVESPVQSGMTYVRYEG